MYIVHVYFAAVCHQVGDFSITLKAPKKNKHFRIMRGDGDATAVVYSIGQQTFDDMDDLVEHYKKHPIYRHDAEKLYLVKSFLHPCDFVGGQPLPELPESPRLSDDCGLDDDDDDEIDAGVMTS